MILMVMSLVAEQATSASQSYIITIISTVIIFNRLTNIIIRHIVIVIRNHHQNLRMNLLSCVFD